tara:strand:- start:42464 stop:43294 length:831 start_codon:yes stop_codon:yes gene_type:complete
MSIKRIPGKMYRMPMSFGPSLGPRQLPEGRQLDYAQAPDSRTLSISFRSNPEQLAALLPECFMLGQEPIVTIFCSEMTNVDWLAGRGYSMVGVTFPARFSGKQDQLEGSFLCVLFENMCEPIITGREELGFSKVYAEINGPTVSDNGALVNVSWHGFDFLEIKARKLHENPTPNQTLGGLRNDGLMHYKYIPKTGDWGSADIEYPTFYPSSCDKGKVTKLLIGDGHFSWNKARWEDLPTLYNIVNTLANLEIIEYLGTSLSYSTGTKDLREQRILR